MPGPGFMAARHDTRLLRVPWRWQQGWRQRLTHAWLSRLFRRAYQQSQVIVMLYPAAGMRSAVDDFIQTLPLPQQLVLLRAPHLDDALAMAHDWAEASGGTRAWVLDFEPPHIVELPE